MPITITLPDGSTRAYDGPITAAQVAADIGPGLAKAALGCRIDGELRGHWKGINWRKTDGLRANAFTLESYVTDRWTKNEVNVVYFDNVVIAKEYIGPAKGRK